MLCDAASFVKLVPRFVTVSASGLLLVVFQHLLLLLLHLLLYNRRDVFMVCVQIYVRCRYLNKLTCLYMYDCWSWSVLLAINICIRMLPQIQLHGYLF